VLSGVVKEAIPDRDRAGGLLRQAVGDLENLSRDSRAKIVVAP
jgi:hypothetical protein